MQINGRIYTLFVPKLGDVEVRNVRLKIPLFLRQYTPITLFTATSSLNNLKSDMFLYSMGENKGSSGRYRAGTSTEADILLEVMK